MTNSSKKDRLSRDQKLIAGANAHLASVQLLVHGSTMTGPSLVLLLQGRVATATKVVTTRAALQAAVQANDAESAATDATVSGAIEAIYVAFGNAPDTLADFGLPVRKTGTMTPAQRLAASVKAKATRAARHTMGAKQKAAITGTTPALAAAPEAPAAPAPAGQTPTTK